MDKTPDTYVEMCVIKFARFNSRHDVKASTWFRLSHSLVTDPDFSDYSHEEFKVWIYILSMASLKNSEKVRIFFDHAKRSSRLSRRGIESAIEKLVRNQCIEVISRYVDGTSAYATNERTNEQTNITNEHARETAPARVGVPEIQGKLGECIAAWGETLLKLRIEKDPRLDEGHIARLIQAHGPEKTRLALIGAGLEKKTHDYDPANHCRITRLTSKVDIFEKFVNLGAQFAGKQTKTRRDSTNVIRDEETLEPLSPAELEAAKARVRSLIPGFGKSIPAIRADDESEAG